MPKKKAPESETLSHLPPADRLFLKISEANPEIILSLAENPVPRAVEEREGMVRLWLKGLITSGRELPKGYERTVQRLAAEIFGRLKGTNLLGQRGTADMLQKRYVDVCKAAREELRDRVMQLLSTVDDQKDPDAQEKEDVEEKPEPDEASPAESAVESPHPKSESVEQPPKRGPGRPRKNPAPSVSEQQETLPD